MPKILPVPNNTVPSKIPFQVLFNSSTPKYIDRIKAHLSVNSQQAIAASSVNGIDPVSLEELQNAEQRRIVNIVGQVRKCGLDSFLALPELVISGDQSVGKNSVLEALTDIPSLGIIICVLELTPGDVQVAYDNPLPPYQSILPPSRVMSQIAVAPSS